jgi:hypothetical protein
MLPSDPNGYPSYEAYIEAHAGACPAPGQELPDPDDWPMPQPPPYEADDENDTLPPTKEAA